MRQLMREREHLRGLGVRTAYKDQRRQWIGKREVAKLGRVESAVAIASYDSSQLRREVARIWGGATAEVVRDASIGRPSP